MASGTYAYRWLLDRGLSPAAAAGIVGNLMAESGMDTRASGDGGTSLGIAQWHAGRKDALLSFARARGQSAYDIDTQLEYLWHELSTSYSSVLRNLRNAGSQREATAIFLRQFEKPADQSDAVVAHRDSLFDPRGGGGGGGGGGSGKRTYGTYGYVQDFLDKHPEIAELIEKAQKQGWLPERLEGEIKATSWWRKRTEDQRRWSLLVAESPAEANKEVAEKRRQLVAAFRSSGVAFTAKEMDALAMRAAVNAWDADEMMLAAARHFDLPKGGQAMSGSASQAANTIDQLAWEYGVRVDRQTRQRWIRRAISGQVDPATIEDRLREQAKQLYAPVADQLNTQTVRDLLAPYMSIAADQLGIPVEQMKASDPKWTQALTGGAKGAMTADEWTRLIRTDARYGWDKSSTARGEAAQLTTALARMFGSGF